MESEVEEQWQGDDDGHAQADAHRHKHDRLKRAPEQERTIATVPPEVEAILRVMAHFDRDAKSDAVKQGIDESLRGGPAGDNEPGYQRVGRCPPPRSPGQRDASAPSG